MKKITVIFFFLLATYSFGQDDTVKLKLFGINVEENSNSEIHITKIDKLGPFGRYSFFRVGDIILSVNNEPVSMDNLIEANFLLDKENEVWIKIFRKSSGMERNFNITLKKSFPMPNFLRK